MAVVSVGNNNCCVKRKLSQLKKKSSVFFTIMEGGVEDKTLSSEH